MTTVAITNNRNAHGVKYSCDQFRAGGDRILWVDGREDALTLSVITQIRAAGFKAWRTKDQVWVRSSDAVAIARLRISTEEMPA